MNENYTIEELMTLFADGEISEADEKRLFDAVSSDPKYHEEFRQALAVQKMLSESPFPIPSQELDNALFEKAGFSEKKKKRAPIFWLNTVTGRSLSVAAAFLLVFGIVSYTSKDENRDVIVSGNNSTIEIPERNSIITSGELRNEVINEKKTVEHKYSAYKKNNQYRIVSNNIFEESTHESNNSVQENRISNNILKNDNVSEEKPTTFTNTIPPIKQNQVEQFASIEKSAAPIFPMKKTYSKFFVEARGAMMLNANAAVGANIAVAGMMRLGEKTWLGLAAGRESLMNNSTNSVPSNDGFELSELSNSTPGGKSANRNEQTDIEETIPPIQNWIGAVAERRFGEVFSGLEPTARVVLGGTGIGPFAKVGAGMMLHFSPSVHASIGFENTGIMYKKNDDWQTTNTIGAICSFALEF